MASKPHSQMHHTDDDDSASSSSGSTEEDQMKSVSIVRGQLNQDTNDSGESGEEHEGNGRSVEDDETSSESQPAAPLDEDDDTSSSGSEIVPVANKSSSNLLSKPKIGLFSSSLNSKKEREALTDTKPRLKLSLKLPTLKEAQAKQPVAIVKKTKLPMQAKSQPETSSDSDSGDEGEVTELQALVVDDDEEAGEVEIVSAVADPNSTSSSFKSKTVSSIEGGVKKSTAAKNGIVSSSNRKSFNPTKQIRIPPIPSPGLYIPSSTTGVQVPSLKSTKNTTGYVTPREVFDTSMEASGVTEEKRKNNPHRGSSVKRTVDDMFDSNIVLTLNFPNLIPEKYLFHSEQVKSNVANENAPEKSTTANGLSVTSESYCQQLLHLVNECCSRKDVSSDTCVGPTKDNVRQPRKRKRPSGFKDMIPVSLTLPFPGKFLEDRIQYVKAVKERENAIIRWQEAQEIIEAESETEASHDDEPKNTPTTIKKNVIRIPDIPVPPEPISIDELIGFDDSILYSRDSHPVYLPSTKELVSHLDSSCFHITEGRYFGLSTNFVADPNFVGANAPGIAGVSSSGSTGLATSTVTGGSTNVGIIFNIGATPAVGAPSSSTLAKSEEKRKITSQLPKSDQPVKKSQSASSPSTAKSSPNKKQPGGSSSTKKSSGGPKPTASNADLRKIMDEGGSTAEKFKVSIMRAAVHSSRLGKHGQPFVGPDGETYPDVSKAFAVHASVKPCQRCKNNKQGVYHCRLRRRHDDPDFDGGKSAALLANFFKAPMSSLLD
jgi:hypothetical protein